MEHQNACRYVAAHLEQSYYAWNQAEALPAACFPGADIFTFMARQGTRKPTPFTQYAATLLKDRETLRIKAHLLRLDRIRRRNPKREHIAPGLFVEALQLLDPKRPP